MIGYLIFPHKLIPLFIFSVDAVTEEVLHSRYLAHVKRESRSYVNQVSKEEQVEQTRVESEEQGDKVAATGEEQEVRQEEGEQWTAELREQLWQEKVHVEEKLRCIQDEHFYELLQVGWLSEIWLCHLSFIFRSDGWRDNREVKRLQIHSERNLRFTQTL